MTLPSRIDAHCHVWRISDAFCTWPRADLPTIHRDYGIDELASLGAPHGFAGCVLVQSQENFADTDWLLALAAPAPYVKGVVGWLDLTQPQTPRAVAELAARHPKLCGLRPMLQDMEPGWLTRHVGSGVGAAMVEAGLVFDALVRPQHLPALHFFAQANPKLTIVIDHAAKPLSGLPVTWADGMRRLAQLPNTSCKISGLLTETPDPVDAQATARFAIDCFGPERVLWGSDWPVLNLVSDYASWFEIASSCAAPEHHFALFGGNARRIYGLDS